MIKMQEIEKYYESKAGKTYVLRRINLDVAVGDFLTIMGPSGAGKSTLLGILGMLDSASEGEYHFFEQAVHKLKPRDRTELHKRYVGFVFQQYHLLDNLTVYENLDIPLSYRNIKKSERQMTSLPAISTPPKGRRSWTCSSG
jgi:ABC-type lipoprotein export system ATPase subunit